jgi:hypothetical protein
MNRIIKEATVKRYHYDNHAQLGRSKGPFFIGYIGRIRFV